MLAGSRILVVEDETLLAMEARNQIAAVGAEVIGPAPSVQAALTALAAEPPDAAVLDVNLRGVWSIPVAQALRATGVPFIIVTGYGRRHLDHPAMRDAPMLEKPAPAGDLVRALQRALSRDL